MPPLHGLERKRYLVIPELTFGHQTRFTQPRRPLPGAPKMSGEIGLLEHLWGRSPFSVRRGAEAAQRADRGDTHTQGFTQLRAARMRKTLLLLVLIDSGSCSGTQEATVSLELDVGGCLL